MYKVWLVAQGFSQRPSIDFDQTYSHVIDTTFFCYLFAYVFHSPLDIYLLDVITSYLYGTLDTNLYNTLPLDFFLAIPRAKPGKYSGINIQKTLHGLKQVGRMWYHHLQDYLISKSFIHNTVLYCIFILYKPTCFVIVAVYVDDSNLIGTTYVCKHTEYIRTIMFDMKLLGRTTFAFVCRFITYLTVVYYSIKMPSFKSCWRPSKWTKLILDDVQEPHAWQPISTLCGGGGDKKNYLTTIGALIYLANHTRRDIVFATSILATQSRKPTMRHWNGDKHLMQYLRGTKTWEFILGKLMW